MPWAIQIINILKASIYKLIFSHTASAQLKLLIRNFADLKLMYQTVAVTFPCNSVTPRKYGFLTT